MSNRMVVLPFPLSLEEELKKNPDLKMSDIQILKEWCEKQKHLPKISDILLLMFLHSNYNSIERAKTTVDNFYTMRTHIPEFFSNRDPIGSRELRQAINLVAAFLLPGLTKEGYKIIYTTFLDPDPSHYVFNDCTKYFFMSFEIAALKTGTCKGYVYIGDSKGVTLGHAGRMSPMGLKKLMCYVQEAAPIRLKAIHFLNTPSALDLMINMAKPFIKKEIMDLMHFHPTLKTLDDFVPIDLLPNEVGGKAGPMSKFVADHVKEIEGLRDWFLEEESIARVDEKLRVGKSKTANELFGVEGSFKKLEID